MPLTWLEPVLWCIAALFAAQTGAACVHICWARRLPTFPSIPTADPRVVSVVLAARDEETRVEHTVRQLLAQRGVRLEIITVDDRSSDRTSEILRRMADEDSRVKPLRVDALPDGWLGKCHACHTGAAAATGEWILFTDADCWLAPDVIARALMVAARERVDHITLTPGIATGGLAARAWHLAFLMSLASWLAGVNRDKPNAHLGMGAFNLVKSTAYHACGGYEALRLTVVDDIKLGRLLQRAGSRTRGFIGGDDTECQWGTSAIGMIGLMEKNYFAAIDYRVGAAVGLAVIAPVMLAGAFVGPFTGTLAGYAAAAALASMAIPCSVLASRLRWPRWTALLTPFIFPMLIYAVLNSTVVTLWHGGIRWRGTFYPLDVLRRGSVH